VKGGVTGEKTRAREKDKRVYDRPPTRSYARINQTNLVYNTDRYRFYMNDAVVTSFYIL